MQHDDSHFNSINLSSSIGSTTRIQIVFPSEYEVWALHFEYYVLGLEDNGYLIWKAIIIGPFVHTESKRVIRTQNDYNKLLFDIKDVPQDEKEKLISNVKALRIIRFALKADTFHLVSSCDTTKAIWDRLKELHSTDADLEHSTQTLLLSEFGAFTQKSEESLSQTSSLQSSVKQNDETWHWM